MLLGTKISTHFYFYFIQSLIKLGFPAILYLDLNKSMKLGFLARRFRASVLVNTITEIRYNTSLASYTNKSE